MDPSLDPLSTWVDYNNLMPQLILNPLDAAHLPSESSQATEHSSEFSLPFPGPIFTPSQPFADLPFSGSHSHDPHPTYAQLKHQNSVLAAELSSLRRAYSTLAAAMPTTAKISGFSAQSSTPPNPTGSLREEDYPLVRFWHRSLWKTHLSCSQNGLDRSSRKRGGVAASQGLNVATQYIENEFGQSVDGYRATEIRRIAHRIFFELANLGLAPKTWGVAGINVTTQFNNKMVALVPEMRYCSNDWKSEYLATHIYPSWYKSHRRGREGLQSGPSRSEERAQD